MKSSNDPLWREEFSIRKSEERYVSRRQLTKFLTLTSLGMFVGNLWVVAKSRIRDTISYPAKWIARAGEIPVGGVKLFEYPAPGEQCLLIRTGADEYVAYSQKCTHLSCAVYYSRKSNKLECPCHNGFFAVEDGRVLAGPPTRPLPRIVIDTRGNELVAVGIKES